MVLNNRDLSQVTWEKRVQLGDGKTESTQSIRRTFLTPNMPNCSGSKGSSAMIGAGSGAAWEEALASDRPVILEFYTDPDVPPLPPHITLKTRRIYDHDAGRAGTRQRPEEYGQGASVFRPARPVDAVRPAAAIRAVTARPYTIPTDAPEADGTYAWRETTLVIATIEAGGHTGLGYTYSSSAAASLAAGPLAVALCGHDAFDIPLCHRLLVNEVRNVGRSGSAATAISALDAALWDVKAKLMDLPLAASLGRARETVPIYGSGGFTSTAIESSGSSLPAGSSVRDVAR